MRLHDALGRAGGAGGIDDVERPAHRLLRVRQRGGVGRVLRMEANQVGDAAEIAFHRFLNRGVHEVGRSLDLRGREEVLDCCRSLRMRPGKKRCGQTAFR
jgi:hypothetical protein